MRKTVSILFGLFIVLLASIVIWYAMHTHQIQAKLNDFVANAHEQRLVKVDFVVNAPPQTPANQALYLFGSAPNLGNWDAAGLPLEKSEDGKYHGSAQVMSGVEYGYKVTRGTWGTVETDAKGEESADHVVRVSSDGQG